MIQRFVFSGSGGQGMISAAIVFAEAAVFGEGLNAVQTQVYGPEARGGAARGDVIIADTEIWFPKVVEPNVLVCLSQIAYDRYGPLVRPGGIAIVDPFYVRRWPYANSREIEIPFRDTIVAANGGVAPSIQGINVCVLGALCRLVPLVSLTALQEALARQFAGRFADVNQRALEAGAGLVQERITTF